MNIQNTSSKHRRLRAYPGPGYFEACVLVSQGPDAKTHGMPSDQHKCANAHTDVRIAYSVVASNAA